VALRLARSILRSIPAALAVLLVGGTALAQGGGDYQAPHDRPGPAVDRVQFRAFNVDLAPQEIGRGSMDLYVYNLKTDAVQLLRDDPNVKLYEAPATTLSVVLNPAPAPQGQLNPFSIKEVREAMHHIIDREFIAQEIYKGLARPMHTHVSPFDYDYTVVAEMLARRDLSYDPERGRQTIADAMRAAGAEMVNNVWHFQGQPIRLIFIVRVEDERRQIGDLIRTELERAGFQVSPIYHEFAPAVLTVYSTDPQQFQWHLYTEGWGRGSAERYDYATLNQMVAPWLGNMPGWQEVGFWQYENPTLDDIGQRIFRGDFADQAERDRLYQEATGIALDESVRIWLATVLNTFPAVTNLQGVTEDVAAGPRTHWTLRSAYKTEANALTIGNLWVWTERSTWNTVGGLGDLYSQDIWRNLHDPPTARHPFSGLPMEFRVTYEVESAGPAAKLDVPQDAVRWDAQAGRFAEVGGGVQATSKVIYDYSKYFQSTWHHGQPITMADIVYSIYQSFDIAYNPEKSQVEFAIATTSRPLLDTFRAFRILDDNRIEVYVDYWHFVPDYIAEYGVPSGLSMPWEVHAAMDDIVFNQRRGAYSDTSAQRFNVDWLSLVQDQHARQVDRTLRQFGDQGVFPQQVFQVGGRSLVTVDQARARYQAARDWFARTGLLVISNGPYQLVRFDPPAQFAELEAFRDPNYPFKPGDWYFGAAPQLLIASTSTSGIPIGREASIEVEVEGPGALGVQYVLLDPATGQVVKAGDAAADEEEDVFTVTLSREETAALTPGLYRLTVTATSDQLSTVAERTLTVEVGEPGSIGQGGDGGNGGGEGSGGGCNLGFATADAGLMALLALGLVALGRKRRK
jgi:peptide/nickel transport system substrate-binding protein